MKRVFYFLLVMVMVGLPLATLFSPEVVTAPAVAQDKDVDVDAKVDINPADEAQLSDDGNTNRILLWGGIILVAALVIGLAMRGRGGSDSHVHVDR